MKFKLKTFRHLLHLGLAVAVLAVLLPALSNTLWVAESPAITAKVLGLIPEMSLAHPLTHAYYRLFAISHSIYTPMFMACGSLLLILASAFLFFGLFREVFLNAVAEASDEEIEQAVAALEGEPEEDEDFHARPIDDEFDDDEYDEDGDGDRGYYDDDEADGESGSGDASPQPEKENDFKRGLRAEDYAKPRHFVIAEAGAALLVLIFCCSAPVRLAATTVNTSCVPVFLTALVLTLIRKFSKTGVYVLIYLSLFLLGASLVESVVFAFITPVLGIYAFITAFRTRGLSQRFLGNMVLFSLLGVFAGIGVVMGCLNTLMPFAALIKTIGLGLFKELWAFIPATRWLVVIGGVLIPPALMAFAIGRLRGAAHRSRSEVWQANVCALIVGLYSVAALAGPDPIPFGIFLTFAHIPVFSALFLAFSATGVVVFTASQFCAVHCGDSEVSQEPGEDDEELLVQDIDEYEKEETSEKVVFHGNSPEITNSETTSFKWMQITVSVAVLASATVSLFLNYNAGNPRAAAFIDRAVDWLLEESAGANVLLCDTELELQLKIKALLTGNKILIYGSEINSMKMVRTFKDLDEAAPDRRMAKWLKSNPRKHGQLAVAANPMVWFEAGISYYPSGMLSYADIDPDDDTTIAKLEQKNGDCWKKIAFEKTDSYREHSILSYYRAYFLYRQSLCN